MWILVKSISVDPIEIDQQELAGLLGGGIEAMEMRSSKMKLRKVCPTGPSLL